MNPAGSGTPPASNASAATPAPAQTGSPPSQPAPVPAQQQPTAASTPPASSTTVTMSNPPPPPGPAVAPAPAPATATAPAPMPSQQGGPPPALPSFNQIAASATPPRPLMGGPPGPFQPRPQAMPIGVGPIAPPYAQYGMPPGRPMQPGPAPKPPQYDYQSQGRPMQQQPPPQPPQPSGGPPPRPGGPGAGYPGMPPGPPAPQPPGAPRIMLPTPRPPGPYSNPYPQQPMGGPDYYGRPPPPQSQQPPPPSAWGMDNRQQMPPPPQQQYPPPVPQPAPSAPPPVSQPAPSSAAAAAAAPPPPPPQNHMVQQPPQQPSSDVSTRAGPNVVEPASLSQQPEISVSVSVKREQGPPSVAEFSPEASNASPVESEDSKIKTRKRAREGENSGGFLGGRAKDNEGTDGAKDTIKRRKGEPIPVRNDPKLDSVPEGVDEVDFGTLLYSPPERDGSEIKLHPLPRAISTQLYSIVRIAVPAELLTVRSPGIRRKCVWGSEIYTDDSDPLAVAVHSGWYRPPDAPSIVVPEELVKLVEGGGSSEQAEQESAKPTEAPTGGEAGAKAPEGQEQSSAMEISDEGDAAAKKDGAEEGRSKEGGAPPQDKDDAAKEKEQPKDDAGKENGGPNGAAPSADAPRELGTKDSWKPPLPRIPIIGDMDPTTKLADHDLIITLRVLPQLVRYTGSLRCGLVSRGWGVGHDGNSIRVIACEKVPPREAMQRAKHSMRKGPPTFGANHDDSDGYLMVMESKLTAKRGGEVETFINYSPPTLNLWPPFLLRIMYQQIDNLNPPPPPTQPEHLERLRKWEEEWKELIGDWEGVKLSDMWQRDWRCWRVRICGKNQTCLMESLATRSPGTDEQGQTVQLYSLKLAKASPLAITNNSDRYNLVNVTTGSTVASNLRPDEIFFEEEGLVIRRRANGAPMPDNGHLEPYMIEDEPAPLRKGGSVGPIEVPTVIPVMRVRWAL